MEQSPLKADSNSAGQYISRLLRNTKIYYSVRRSPLVCYILSQLNPIHKFTPFL